MHKLPEREGAAPRVPTPKTATDEIPQIRTPRVSQAVDIRDRRRASRELDDLLCILTPTVDVIDVDWYRICGLHLDVPQRERAGRAA